MPKRGKKAGGKEEERQPMPAAQTFFRFAIANTAAMETVRKLALKQSPQLLLRDGPRGGGSRAKHNQRLAGGPAAPGVQRRVVR